MRNFVFQVHTSSPLHWYLHWRRSKTREWWVELQPHKKITRMYKCTTENERFLLFPLQITVSSGGMLTQKLDVDDLQFEKGTFDGTMAYAQNKVEWLKDVAVYRGIVVVFILICIFFFVWQRQQVILTERWAAQHKEIHFSSMHPGWADTPGEEKKDTLKLKNLTGRQMFFME